MKELSWKLAALIGSLWATSVPAADAYLGGHINDVTFAGSDVMVRLDTGVPDNCTGTPFGWMLIPNSAKPMQAFVIGLWMRGDAAQTYAVVYTTAVSVGGYCIINQLDPVN